MIDRSRRPAIAMFSVRGIGVAVSVSRSTSARSFFSASFWRTPKRCSSSTMTRPRSLNFTSGCSSLCVPIITSIWPSASLASASSISFFDLKRDSTSTRDRPVGVAVAEVLVMLLREQGGRREHRDLLAGGRGDERGAQRDFGLAETDVAADDAVHRSWRGEIGDDRLDRGAPGPAFPRTETRRRTARTSRDRRRARCPGAPRAARRSRAVRRRRRALSRDAFFFARSHASPPSECSGASSGAVPE